MEDRAGVELEDALVLVVDGDAGDVGGQQVGRELDPRVGALHGVAERPGQHGLAGAGQVLEQQVALGDQAGQRQPDHPVLAEQGEAHVVGHVGEPGLEPRRAVGTQRHAGEGNASALPAGPARRLAPCPRPPACSPPGYWGAHLLALVLVGAAALARALAARRLADPAGREATDLDGGRRPSRSPRCFGPDDPFPGDRIGQPVDVVGTWLPEETVYVSGRTGGPTDADGVWVGDPGRGRRRGRRRCWWCAAGPPTRPRRRPPPTGRGRPGRPAPTLRRAPARSTPTRPTTCSPALRVTDVAPAPRRRPVRRVRRQHRPRAGPGRGHRGAAAAGRSLHRAAQPALRPRVVGVRRRSPRSSGGGTCATSSPPRPWPGRPRRTPYPRSRDRRPHPLPRHGVRRRHPARGPGARRTAPALRLPAVPRGAARGRPGLAGRRRHLAVPRRRARLALHDLRDHGLPALPQGRLGPALHPGDAGLRHRPDPVLLGRAPGHRPGPRGVPGDPLRTHRRSSASRMGHDDGVRARGRGRARRGRGGDAAGAVRARRRSRTWCSGPASVPSTARWSPRTRSPAVIDRLVELWRQAGETRTCTATGRCAPSGGR